MGDFQTNFMALPIIAILEISNLYSVLFTLCYVSNYLYLGEADVKEAKDICVSSVSSADDRVSFAATKSSWLYLS